MRSMIKRRWELQKLFMFLQLILCPIVAAYLLTLRDWNTMPPQWLFSIALDMFGMAICILLFVSVVKNRSDISFRTDYFSYLIGILGLEMFLSLCTWLVDGIVQLRTLNMLLNVLSSALSSLLLLVAWFYLIEVADLDTPAIKKCLRHFNSPAPQ